MKKYLKIGIPLLLILVCAAVYAFVPGAKTVTHQTARATKAVAAHYQLTSSVDAFSLRQVITADSKTSRTIMWQSQMDEKDAVAEYRLKGSDDAYALKAVNDTYEDDGTTLYVHTAELTGLEPGKTYEYRVGYGEKRSDWHELTTAGNDSTFKAIIFPDSQSSDYSVWKDTAEPAWKANQDAAFFINMGDLVDNGEDHNQWNAWFDTLDGIGMIDRIPVAPLMGNHETYNENWKVRMPVSYLHMFSLPKVTPEKYQNQYYSFDYGDIHFVVLNTQLTEMTEFQPDMLADEIAWFKNDMEKTDKKWKVVLMHKDVLQYSFQNRPEPRPEGISEEGRAFMPLFDEYKVDVVLTAHLHTYRNRGHIQNFQRNANGPLYIITGVAGNVRYPGLWKQHALDETVAPQPETDNYMTLEASENELQFKSFLPSGELLDNAAVQK